MIEVMTNQLPAQRPQSLPTRPHRIGLALGGGGARGLSHILALEAFDELGVQPALLAGTSIGAIFAAAYASGLTAVEVRALAEDLLTRRFELIRQVLMGRTPPLRQLLNVLPLRSALLEPKALLELVLPGTIPATFAELRTPLSIVATDVGSREAVVFDSGNLREAIAASIAIPIVFAPVFSDGRTLSDGGLVNPLPYDVLQGRVDIVVAMDVSGGASEAVVGPKPSMATMLTQSVQILQKRIIRERLRYNAPDIYIDVDVDRFGAFQFHKLEAILEAAQPAKRELKARLERILASEPAAT